MRTLLEWVRGLFLGCLDSFDLVSSITSKRDRQSETASSVSHISSASTIRPPSTTRARNDVPTVPVLNRSNRVHVTPPLSQVESPPLRRGSKDKDGEGELEIDLESLGLEDKEIPPDKLVKLEKIGSGGFKEYVLPSPSDKESYSICISVYVGKLRGRVKVAIAEFRGQLSASGYI